MSCGCGPKKTDRVPNQIRYGFEGESITISMKEYDHLRESRRFLNKLEELGVDKWEKYLEAVETVYGPNGAY